MQLRLYSTLSLLLIALSLFVSVSASASQHPNMADKKAIVQIKKTSSAEDRAAIVSDLKAKGATIVSEENLNSKIFPFITVSIKEDSFSSLQSDFDQHHVVENIEADQEVHTQ